MSKLPVTPPSPPSRLAHQAIWRILAALVIALLFLGLASWWVQETASIKEANNELAFFREYYRERINQKEQAWKSRSIMLREKLKYFNLLKKQDPDRSNLEEYLRLVQEKDQPATVILTDVTGKVLLAHGDHSLFSDTGFPHNEDSGWYYSIPLKILFRYYAQPIHIDSLGTSRLVVFTPADSSLLQEMIFPETSLTILWEKQQVAQSHGYMAMDIIQPNIGIHSHGDGIDIQESLPWGQPVGEVPTLIIHKHIQPFFTHGELLLALVGIFLVATVSFHFTVGSWLLKTARRISLLGGISRDYSEKKQLTQSMLAAFDEVENNQDDEISRVALSLKEMTHGIEQRIMERVEHEKKLSDNEKRLREITSMIADGVIVINTEGKLTFLNPQGELLLGWKEDELLGKNSHAMFHHLRPDGSHNPEDSCPIHRTVTSGSCVRVNEDYFVRRDNSFLPVSLASAPILRDGEIKGAVITFQDISERLQAEKKILENQKRFHQLFNIAHDATFVVAILPEGRFGPFLEVNDATCQRYGYSREELLCQTPAILNPPEGQKNLDQLALDIVEQQHATFERWHVTRDGRRIPVEISSQTFEFQGQKAVLSLVRDISERQIQERKDLRAFVNRIALNALLEVALEPLSLKRKLQVAMDIIHTVPRMALQAKGSIMLVTEEGDLELFVERNLSRPLLEKCKRIPFGYCLCGRAAQSRELVFAAGIDHRHDVTFAGIQPHGHYCVPIISREQLLGVLNLYVDQDHPRDHDEEAFLITIANTLAGVIERGKVDEKIQHMASHDALTGLPNRRLFQEHLEQELRHAIREKHTLVVAFLDLDRFKQVNDTLGHEAGDILLKS
ncbi:MAG TPA: PAS domain S-box protein, partial [Magnetococcales bacterium]|nr:PAS domain S-box protein [Magnetococcales bacterium]